VTGHRGVLDTACRGAVVVDMTTSNAKTSRAVAALCAAQGVRYLDAPVTRGLVGAENGTLSMLVGGDEQDLDAARPVLEVLASDIVRVGPVGAGQIAKLCNNMLAAIHAVALGEVLTAGVKAGISLADLTESISRSSGTSFILEHYLPNCLFGDERPTTFALSLMCKDLALFMDTVAPPGSNYGVTLPVSSLVQQLYAAASASGRDGSDFTSVAELFEGFAGIELRLAPDGTEAER
jgi:3-hydroxyisobutyrate dehydrogenase